MKHVLICIVSLFLLVCTAHASPMTITFNDTPAGAGLDGNSVDIGGVIFDGWVIGFGVAGSILTPITAAPTITFGPDVTLLGFDYWSLFDVTLSVDSTDYLLLQTLAGETFSTSIAANTLSFHMSGFPYVGAIGLDNLTYETTVAHTPIPGALALLGAGLLGIVGLRKKLQT